MIVTTCVASQNCVSSTACSTGIAKNAGGAHGNEATGRFELWLCNECGYSELWAHDFAHLTPDPANGIRHIDARPQRGTFR